MGKTKLKVFLLAVAVLFLTVASQATIAYYSTVGSSTNVVTSGSIKLIIHESTEQGASLPEGGVYVVPGDIVSKKVNVENACEHPFYLRVKIIYGVNGEELSADDCFKLNIDENKWILHSDGWYYYNAALEPGETTDNVFSHVEIVGSKVDNSYLGKTLTLTVKAEAVQSENNPVEDGRVFEALGWPNE